MHQVHRLHAPQHSCMDDLQGTQQLVCRFAAHTSGTVTAADLSALRLSTMATRTKNFIRRTASKLAAPVSTGLRPAHCNIWTTRPSMGPRRFLSQ